MTVYDDDKENDKNLPRRSMSPLSSRVSQTVDTWALIIFINHDNQISQCPMFPVWKVSPRVSGNPLAIMLFYQAVRGGCLETGALSCRDNISFCGHTPTSQPRRHHSRKKSKNMFYWNLRIGDNTTIKLNKLYFKLSKTLLIILHNLQYIARYFDKDFSNFVIFSRKCHFLHLWVEQLTEKAAAAMFKVSICSRSQWSSDHVSAPRPDKGLQNLGAMICPVLPLCTTTRCRQLLSRQFLESHFSILTFTAHDTYNPQPNSIMD